MEKLKNDVIDAIIIETVSTLPCELQAFYSNPPGRRPSELSKSISNSFKKLNKQEIIDIIRAVVDSSVFSILYLVESNFKELNVDTTFTGEGNFNFKSSDGLIDLYRSKIAPGGIAAPGAPLPQ